MTCHGKKSPLNIDEGRVDVGILDLEVSMHDLSIEGTFC